MFPSTHLLQSQSANRPLLRFLALAVFLPSAFAQRWIPQQSHTTASLRGISVVDSRVVWASGTGGTFLRTLDGGSTWKPATVRGAFHLDFRGVVAFGPNRALLMSSGVGRRSVVIGTGDGGRTWTTLFRNPDDTGFFDALVFEGDRHGFLLGDPVGGKFSLFRTEDGGKHWIRLVTSAVLTGEGAFAASNSALAIRGCNRRSASGDWVLDGCEVLFGSGGPGAARTFYSSDGGAHWSVASTSIRRDAASAGIFSLAFRLPSGGLAVGGAYTLPGETLGNVAAGHFSSQPWTAGAGRRPGGYRSAVVYLKDLSVWLTAGPTGSDISRDGGTSWHPIGYEPVNALAGSSAHACWAAGPHGFIGRLTSSRESE